MPGIGGIEACRKLRRMAPGLQILMLTVRDSEGDRVRALDAGADDFITKPFSIPELAARLRSAVRRAQTALPDMAALIGIGDIQLDPGPPHRAQIDTRRAPYSQGLRAIASPDGARRRSILTHARLLRAIWGPEYGGEIEYLRTFIHQLRHRLEDDPAAPEYLLTETGLGYRFREP
jgi:two-component system KDP operon response regulator KdpE